MPLSLPDGLKLTFYGHSTLKLTLPNGKNVLFDPFVEHNPLCPVKNADIGPLDYILITHGHADHMADAVPIATLTGAQVVANFEIGSYLNGKGIQNTVSMNTGGTVALEGLRVTQTQAFHSSGIEEGDTLLYAGSPSGYIVRLDNGFTLYNAGDTAVFGDMALLAAMYKPDLCLLPIGDHFTMGPYEAAHACRLLQARYVVPIHYATFPLLTGTPEAFQSALKELSVDTEVVLMKPGQTL